MTTSAAPAAARVAAFAACFGFVGAEVAVPLPDSRRLRGNSSAVRKLSDSQVSCEDGFWDNINWCGGGGDWSCTPWGFKVDWTSECDSGGSCFTPLKCDGTDADDLIVGDDSGAATYIAKWQKSDGSWCDCQSCCDDPNYYVFHTCDGAGLQSDCKGSQWYVEQLSQWNIGNSGYPQSGQVHPTGTQSVSFNFKHPGTGNDYEWYWCGWWSKTSAWAGWDASAGWIAATGLDPTEHTPSWARDAFGGNDADATMALYPWICTVDDSQGERTGIQKGAAMYAGDHDNGVWDCFCDNNGPGGLPSDTQPPPHFKMYSMRKEVDGDGNSYLHVVGVAGDAIDPGVSNEDFHLYGFDAAW